MTRVGQGYLLLAGSVDDAKVPGFALYRWSGPGGPAPEKVSVPFQDLRPEALTATASHLLILSDDGDEVPRGAKEKCKKPDAAPFRRFSGRVIPLADLHP